MGLPYWCGYSDCSGFVLDRPVDFEARLLTTSFNAKIFPMALRDAFRRQITLVTGLICLTSGLLLLVLISGDRPAFASADNDLCCRFAFETTSGQPDSCFKSHTHCFITLGYACTSGLQCT